MILFARCESPIETEMLTMLSSMLGNRRVESEARTIPTFRDHVMSTRNFGRFVLGAQVKVLGYRTDIVVGVRTPMNVPFVLVIECDGWEYHGQCWQRERDAKRDDAMIKSGLVGEVQRFAGRRINEDAIDIAQKLRIILDYEMDQPPDFCTAIRPGHEALMRPVLWQNGQWQITDMGLVSVDERNHHFIPWHVMDDNKWVHVMAQMDWVNPKLFDQAFYFALRVGSQVGGRLLGRVNKPRQVPNRENIEEDELEDA